MRLPRSVVTRAALLAALLTVFVGPTLAPTAAHAETARLVPTRIAAMVAPHWVAPGGSTTIHGALLLAGQPDAGQPVELLQRVAGTGTFTSAGTSTTAVDGSVSFTVSPSLRTVYKLRYDGSDTAAPSTSHRLLVRIGRPTRLAIAVSQGTVATRILGELRGSGHGLRGKPVVLESFADGVWSPVTTKLTQRHGRVQFALPAATTGTYRLGFPGIWRYVASTSATVTLG